MESIVAKLDAALYPAVCSVNTYLSNYILVFLLVAVGYQRLSFTVIWTVLLADHLLKKGLEEL